MVGAIKRVPRRSAPCWQYSVVRAVCAMLVSPALQRGVGEPTIHPESRRDDARAPRAAQVVARGRRKRKSGATSVNAKLPLPPAKAGGLLFEIDRICSRLQAQAFAVSQDGLHPRGKPLHSPWRTLGRVAILSRVVAADRSFCSLARPHTPATPVAAQEIATRSLH